MIREIDRVSALPFASPSGFVMAQSALPEAHQILLIAQDHHRVVVDAIENREILVTHPSRCHYICGNDYPKSNDTPLKALILSQARRIL